MWAVAAAPSCAAEIAALQALAADWPAARSAANAVAAGCRASSIVRSPGLAPPSSDIASTPAARAVDQSTAAGLSGKICAARSKAVVYSGPEVPPTARRRALAIAISTASGRDDQTA